MTTVLTGFGWSMTLSHDFILGFSDDETVMVLRGKAHQQIEEQVCTIKLVGVAGQSPSHVPLELQSSFVAPRGLAVTSPCRPIRDIRNGVRDGRHREDQRCCQRRLLEGHHAIVVHVRHWRRTSVQVPLQRRRPELVPRPGVY